MVDWNSINKTAPGSAGVLQTLPPPKPAKPKPVVDNTSSDDSAPLPDNTSSDDSAPLIASTPFGNENKAAGPYTSTGEENVASTQDPLWREIGMVGGGVVGAFLGGPAGAAAGVALGGAGGAAIDEAVKDDEPVGGPGAAGNGMYSPNPNAYQSPNQPYRQYQLESNLGAYQQRGAPTVQGPTLGSAATTAAPIIDPAANYAAAQGAAAQAQGTSIGRQDMEFRNNQTNLANQLALQSQGLGPSLAGEQLKQGTDRAIAQQIAATASARGGMNPALAARNAQIAGITMQQDAATQAAQLRMQEQLNAQQGLANVAGTARGQDIGVNTSQAQLGQDANFNNANLAQGMTLANVNALNNAGQYNAGAINTSALSQANLFSQANLANQNALNNRDITQAQMSNDANKFNASNWLATQQSNDAMVRYFMEAGLSLDEAQRQANIQRETTLANQSVGLASIAENRRQYDQNSENAAMSGLIQGGLQAYSMSQAGDTGGTNAATGGSSGQSAYYASQSAGRSSDKRAKENIKGGDKPIKDLYHHLISSPAGKKTNITNPNSSLNFLLQSYNPTSKAATAANAINLSAPLPVATPAGESRWETSAREINERMKNNPATAINSSNPLPQITGLSLIKDLPPLANPAENRIYQPDIRNQSKYTPNVTPPASTNYNNGVMQGGVVIPGGVQSNYGVGNGGSVTIPSGGSAGGYNAPTFYAGTNLYDLLPREPSGPPEPMIYGEDPLVMDASMLSRPAAPASPAAKTAANAVGNTVNSVRPISNAPTSLPPNSKRISDKKAKENIKGGDNESKRFLDNIKGYQYNYKNPNAPGAGKGTFVGPMAQDLEKAGPVGKSMVVNTPDGKMVDYPRALATMLASEAMMNERLNKLEKKGKK